MPGMIQQLAPPNDGLLSPTSIRHAPVARGPQRGPSLPERYVTEVTIEDVYVRFILCCNPGVPPDTDPTALKEAFRLPPKSEGKLFSTFTLYKLIGKLMQKEEIKTWGDLALKLGVERPNTEKNQSSQKIQQYAVRLKRWMKSMHIDAFFDYLYNNPHSYWTQIPPETTPILHIARDGVSPEDDMALRALVPQIRPRRGRRTREDEDANKSPCKVPRMESPMGDDLVSARPEPVDLWSAHPHPDGRASLNPPGQVPPTSLPGHPWMGELNYTPITAYPQSAITPSTSANFWADEPKSAITPSKSKTGSKRHGPKVVSSAWRSGPGGSGKTRGRPPINRAANDGAFSAYPTGDPSTASSSTYRRTTPPDTTSSATAGLGGNVGVAVGTAGAEPRDGMALGHTDMSPPPPFPPPMQPVPPAQHAPPPMTTSQTETSIKAQENLEEAQQQPPPARPAKPSRLSLQVPKRVGGEVRLATPPPVLMVNGEAAPTNGNVAAPMSQYEAAQPPPAGSSQDPLSFFGGGGHGGAGGAEGGNSQGQRPEGSNGPGQGPGANPGQGPNHPSSTPVVQFGDPSNRTNVEAVEGFFMHEILTGIWSDKDGNRIPTCGVDEAYAIVTTVIENLRKAAVTKEGFLINVSALAGGKLLMTTSSLRITRVEVCEDHTKYVCDWSLQLGSLEGTYSMKESVLHSLWKRPEDDADEAALDCGGAAGEGEGEGSEGEAEELTAAQWKRKYRQLTEMYNKKDQEAARTKYHVMKALRDPRFDRGPDDPGSMPP